MFLDTPDRAAYKSGMSLEEFALAAAPKEMHDALKGKMPEMRLDGISLDTKALEAFHQNMTTVGTRVMEEKKEFQNAKKWVREQHERGMQAFRAARDAEERKKEASKKRWNAILSTLGVVAFFALFFMFAKFWVPENPMSALRFISSGWAKALAIIITFFSVCVTWYIASDVEYKDFGKTLKFIASLTGIISTIFLFISLKGVAAGTYDISSKQELLAARHFPVGSSFTLVEDVDMEGAKVKYLFKEFTGTFEGGGHTISNVEIKTAAYAGLFRKNKGTIQNLNVSGITVNWKAKRVYPRCEFRVGTIVAINESSGKVENCSAKDSKLVLADSGSLIGDVRATAQNYVSSNHGLGAVIGYSSGTYSNISSENVTTDFYVVYSYVSGSYFGVVGYKQ